LYEFVVGLVNALIAFACLMTPAMYCRHVSDRSENRFAALPDRLVAVHARTVVAVNRLGHEAGGLAVNLRDLLDAIFVNLQMVGHLHHG